MICASGIWREMLRGDIWREMLKGVPAVVVSLILGSIAAYIAFRQYRVAHAKLKLDLFEKRFQIYLRTAHFLSQLWMTGVPEDDPNAVPIFRGQIGGAVFLFEKDVSDFLEEVAAKADSPPEQNDEVKRWAETRFKTLETRFQPYMTLSNWR